MGDQARGNQNRAAAHDPNQAFLPNLCSTAAVLSLVLVGELLSLALVVAGDGVANFSWANFGLISMLVQWVVLSSAGSLCLLRPVLFGLKASQVVSIGYAIVLAYTVLFSLAASSLVSLSNGFSWDRIATNVLIAAIFAGVLFRYLYLQQRLKQQERSELGARVQALQSRIRPHFLFNSLNSIASLITVKPELAEKLVVDLAHLFRASLQLPQLIDIKKELELCYCFANIEKIRLGPRLEIDWQVGEFEQGTEILNLLLQPLLENAIYHGIQPLADGGRVSVEVKAVEGDVVLRITNPRLPGSDSKKHQNTVVSSGNGIALSNIRGRLEAHYGKQAYLRVVKGEDDFSVVVRYPATRASRAATH